MRTRRPVAIGLVTLVCALPLGFVSSASAQTPEAFRVEAFDYMTELEAALRWLNTVPAVNRQFGKRALDAVTQLEYAKASLAELSLEDLAKMEAAHARTPGWRGSPRAIAEVAWRVSRGGAAQQLGVGGRSGIGTNFIIPDLCPDISWTPSFAEIAIAEGILITADSIMEAMPSDWMSIVGRQPAVGARAAAHVILSALNMLRRQYDDCTALSAGDVQGIVNGAKAEIVDNVNANTSSIINNDNNNAVTLNTNVNNTRDVIIAAASANTASIIQNDNANRTLIINNDNANADLQLRRLIEMDLASADNATPVAQYLTPQARGGQAELVAAIVADTVADVQALGGSVAQAQSFLSQANAALAAGNFKTAYSLYRKAYRAATNALG